MNVTKRIAAAAGALTLGAAGVAAAATTPDAADDGLTKASAKVGIELPASQDSHPTAEESTEDETIDEDATEDEGTEDESTEDEGIGPVDNHGAEVSAVAHSDFATGREHGEAVSAVAKDNDGAEAGSEADADEASDAAPEGAQP